MRSETRNMLLAVLLSTIVLMAWQYFYTAPRVKQLEQKQHQQELLVQKSQESIAPTVVSRGDAIKGIDRIQIDSPLLHGSIALKGAEFDDLTLAKYKQSQDKNSKDVVLLSPANTKERYFARTGWMAVRSGMKVPHKNTVWTTDSRTLKAGGFVTLRWENGEGLTFIKEIHLDKNYLFTIKHRVENQSASDVILLPFGLINRNIPLVRSDFYILHEGLLGVFDERLIEYRYDDIQDEIRKEFKQTNGWLGITDKYWLTAFIPSNDTPFNANFSYHNDRYQVDYLGEKMVAPASESISYTTHFFAGAKQLHLLESYGKQLEVPLLDRAVDFGYLYFITKPMFKLLMLLQSVVVNFGLAILALTVLIKLALFPLAQKSFTAMSQMRKFQPQIVELRERYKDDKMRMNQEVMALYKREKVNPMAGCLPLVIQIPIFFAIYKVLFVTIEMRHAPFYGWINDLSAPDPTSVFTLFGLIPINLPAMLSIGIWPIIMGVTMIIQQKLNPKPTDPTQEKIMTFMPYFFVFILGGLPAGLVIYWSWSNVLSILQQWVINRRIEQD